MILSKEDYLYYLKSDKIALNINRKKPRIIGDDIWKFEILMRKVEYINNCKESPHNLYLYYLKYKYYKMQLKLGFTIPINTCGHGLSIAHTGLIVINGNARIGKNCRMHVGVNIGVGAGTEEVPTIGDNVYIGPGAKIFGNICIANNIAIGANSVVNKSFNENGITIAGVPAKKVSDKGSKGLLIKYD